MRIVRRILSLTMVAVMMLSLNGMAAIVGNEDFISAYEFLEIKNNVTDGIDKYNANLSMNIDKTIDKYKAKMDVGASTKVLDLIFPIGSKIVASIKPTIGTWKEVTDATGCALWLSGGAAWGTKIDQMMPGFTFASSGATSTYKHKHTFTGTQGNVSSNNTGDHIIKAEQVVSSAAHTAVRGTIESMQAGSHSVTSSSAGAHSHTYTASGTISSNGAHTHTVKLKSGVTTIYSESQTLVQPNAICIKIWERLA